MHPDRFVLPITHVLSTWIVLVYASCAFYANIHPTRYFRIGPDAALLFLGFSIDTWGKWTQVVVLVCVTQCIFMLSSESVSPWIMNTVMDQKTTRIAEHSLPTTRVQVQYICNVYYMFSATVQLLQVQIVVAQADLAAVIILVDLIVSVCTTHMFLRSKESVGVPVVAEEGEESEDLVCKTGDDACRADDAL